MIRWWLALTTLLIGCGTRTVVIGDPIEIIAESAFTGTAHYGVIEVWDGTCEATTSLRRRTWFPSVADPMMMNEALALPNGDPVCVRIFAVRDEEETPGRSCTLIGFGEANATPGVTEDNPLVISVNGLDPMGVGGLSSERDLANVQFGGTLCPPRTTAPFEGERVGAADPPTFRFGRVEEASQYCLRVTSEDGLLDQEVPIEQAGAATLQTHWTGDELATEHGAFTWRVRACPNACPGLAEAPLRGSGAECTTYSPTRTFVRRPWGDLNGDRYEDFVLTVPGDVARVFRSGPGAGPSETYELCGQPYHVVNVTRDLTAAECGASGPFGIPSPFFGVGSAMLDVAGDVRAELLIGAANCQRANTATDELDRGGAIFFYDSELTPTVAHVFAGDPSPVVFELYGLDIEAAFRGGARATELATLGGELIPGLLRHRTSTSSLLPDAGVPTLGPAEESEQRSYTSGHGDLNGDGVADLPLREVLRLAQPRREGETSAFRDRPIQGRRGWHAVILGDDDQNGRAELLISDASPDDACEVELRLVQLAEAESAAAPAVYETLLEWDRALPLLGRADCTGANAGDIPECVSGVCAADDNACPVCRTSLLSDTMLATGMPLGADWAGEPGALAVDRRASGLVATTRSGTEVPLQTAAPLSYCAGVQMRGLYDLDGDGKNELLVLDPNAGTLLIACGDDPSPDLRVVRNQDLIAFEPSPSRDCFGVWSFAP